MSTVHVVVPDGLDDPLRPSGGNVYDRRVCGGLVTLGWSTHEHPVQGEWPRPGTAAREGLAGVLDGLPGGALVLLDGLVASAAPEVVLAHAVRLRLVVLVHTPLGVEAPERQSSERAMLSVLAAVVTTSRWTRQWLLDHYDLPAAGVHVAQPGTDAAGLAPGAASGGRLLCVAAVTPAKGYDVLLTALTALQDLPWRCVCIGSLSVDPAFADRTRIRAREGGIAQRVRFAGPKTGAELEAEYAAADVLVLASRTETFGMVVTEALARGIPVVATNTGGVPEAIGRTTDGGVPGLLVPRDSPAHLEATLRRWLGDPGLRESLRAAARTRRAALPDWGDTSSLLSRVLTDVARGTRTVPGPDTGCEPPQGSARVPL
ncbi:MAG: glycosyltransferase family 4 protein [Nocardioidaceae bacterium]